VFCTVIYFVFFDLDFKYQNVCHMLAVIERVKTGKQQNTNNVYKVLKTT